MKIYVPYITKTLSIICVLFCHYITKAQINSSLGIVFKQEALYLNDREIYYTVVQEILPNTPAAKTDIKVKDKLIGINGIAASSDKKDLEKINQIINDKNRASIALEFERIESYKQTTRRTYVLSYPDENKVQKPKIFGIGVTLVVDSILESNKIKYVAKIQAVYLNSPAYNAMLEAGDCIVAVDNKNIDGSYPDVMEQIIDVLLIDEPRKANLSILRKQEGKLIPLDIHLTRADITQFVRPEFLSADLQHELLKKEKSTPPKDLPYLPDDTDGDGILNKDDACPEETGRESLNPFENGCPEKK